MATTNTQATQTQAQSNDTPTVAEAHAIIKDALRVAANVDVLNAIMEQAYKELVAGRDYADELVQLISEVLNEKFPEAAAKKSDEPKHI
jgi:predicted Ser/Thr protein kinase